MELYFLKNNIAEHHPAENIRFDYTCDVLCVGAGCGGIYAADAAAREGADVILIENSENIGGMHICGNVLGYYYGAEGGSYTEDDINSRNETIFFSDTVLPEQKQMHLTKRLKKSGVKLYCAHTPVGIYFEENRAVGLKVFNGTECIHIKAEMIIDATSDGHIIRMCPVAIRYGRPVDGKTAPFTVRTQFISDGVYHTNNFDSGYVNHYDSRDFSKKTILAHAKSTKFIHQGEYISLASLTGIREGLSFDGEERITYTDIILNKQPEKVLFYAYSDLDKHGHDLAMEEDMYQNWRGISNLSTVTARIAVPMGSVVPRGLCGIVTACRCLSCDSYSQSAVRMNRDMFRIGECVGTAAAMAVKNHVPFLEIDYDAYVEKVRNYGCFDGDAQKSFGFHFPGNNMPYTPVVFDVDMNLHLLDTETPGVAIWSCFISDNRPESAEKVCKKLEEATTDLSRYNCGIALGIMEDKRALPVLREIIEKRDCFYFKDCRRTNQFRTAIAVCLMGRVGEAADAQLLCEIIFNDSEYENTMYHTLKPDYLYYAGTDCNFVYFDVFTHACMALVKIYKRNCLNVKDLHEKFKTLFADEKIIRRVTDSKADAPTHIEIADFQKYILKMTEE